MQRLIEADILEMIKTFADQGHSGSSASYCIPIINRLLKREPITPLTGRDDEWRDVGNGMYQNRRCPNIFKDKERFEGRPYTTEGKIFSDNNGKTWYINVDSFVPIEFPYMPKEPEHVFLRKKV